MKKKIATIALAIGLMVTTIAPVAVHAYDSWDYGIDHSKNPIEWYNHYYHSSLKHYGSITKNGYTYYGPTASAGYWSRLNLEVTGPYAVTYNRHTIF
ncbi:hypothetical protein [Clostridium hydrogeniformans]|uniref:hypothetical protein n=1 Tax=Clostridium hydrogeniformans TaxID=349933 RepID=UPI000489E009|nr:hypothetical protein [Clostridium hydrogeniformans]